MAGNTLDLQDRRQVRDILSLIAGYDEAVAKIAALGPADRDNAQEAIKDGDWAKYGKYMDELEKYLNQLAE